MKEDMTIDCDKSGYCNALPWFVVGIGQTNRLSALDKDVNVLRLVNDG